MAHHPNEWQRALVVLAIALTGVATLTLLLAAVIVGDRTPALGNRDAVAPEDGRATQPIGAGAVGTGPGGTVTVTGDRSAEAVFDREVRDPEYSLTSNGSRIFFAGQPARVARIQIDGLEFYLDPDDCAVTPTGDDTFAGLVLVELACANVTDIRETATVTLEGMLRLSADQLGLRGGLPESGGQVTVGDETLGFDVASLDLQRPAVVQTGPNSFERDPRVYPVSIEARGAALHFEYDSDAVSLRLIGVEAEGLSGTAHGGDCVIGAEQLGALSPQVTVVALTVQCSDLLLGSQPEPVSVEGVIVVDVTAYPPSGLR